jgi:hypothetical protein
MGQGKSKSSGRRAIDAQQVLPEDPYNLNLSLIKWIEDQQILPEIPNVKFRVLIIGRANAGKTSILQRVCDTTESPEIYRLGPRGERERVRSLS